MLFWSDEDSSVYSGRLPMLMVNIVAVMSRLV
jgi:hypothetical protein